MEKQGRRKKLLSLYILEKYILLLYIILLLLVFLIIKSNSAFFNFSKTWKSVEKYGKTE